MSKRHRQEKYDLIENINEHPIVKFCLHPYIQKIIKKQKINFEGKRFNAIFYRQLKYLVVQPPNTVSHKPGRPITKNLSINYPRIPEFEEYNKNIAQSNRHGKIPNNIYSNIKQLDFQIKRLTEFGILKFIKKNYYHFDRVVYRLIKDTRGLNPRAEDLLDKFIENVGDPRFLKLIFKPEFLEINRIYSGMDSTTTQKDIKHFLKIISKEE